MLAALAATPAVAQPPQGAGGGVQPNGLALPPGYRPRTPPPQAQPQPARPNTAAPAGHGGSGAGKVMYFQKPADALTATGASDAADATAVAQRTDRAPVVPVSADVPAPALLPPPPAPPESRYVPPSADAPPIAVAAPAAAPVAYQPPTPPLVDPVIAQKQPLKIPQVPPEYIRLPPRDNIFMVYNDLELEKAIMERLRQDLREQYVRQFESSNKRKPTAEEQQKHLENQEKYLVFPALPVVNPPGVPYQSKTAAYAPSKMILEPGYVVHRRLHFEEKNGERAGWDLGPLSTVVSAAYFYRDVLLWPQSLASGCVTGFWSTNAGKCLPGSPSPYYLYPPGLTVSGTAFETLVVTGAAFIFP